MKIATLLHCYIAKQFNNLTIKQFKNGYTLIELVIVLGLLSMGVGAITLFLTSVLRGTNKANVTAEVKQNGQAVLDSLERQIRGASYVEDKGGNYIRVIRSAGEPLHIRCDSTDNLNHRSRILLAVSNELDLDIANSIWRSVSNDDPKDGISIDDCRLDVFVSSASTLSNSLPTVVSIRFVATRESGRADYVARAQFQTTISLRQY